MPADSLTSEDTGLTEIRNHQSAQDAPDAVNGSYVQRVVYPQLLLDQSTGKIAYDACRRADNDRSHWIHCSRGRRNGCQSRDGIGDDSDQATVDERERKK